MGVLNVTPDSFFDGGHYFKPGQAIDRGIRLEDEGADILDIGGESTRPPHFVELPFEEETRRILPVIEGLRKRLSIPISVDTYKAAVARRAIAAGAEIVNDIGGLRFDSNLAAVVAETKVAVVIMHSRGTPTAMHGLPQSSGIVRLVVSGLRARVQKARKAGILLSRIVIDPGIGFGKQLRENLKLLHNLNSLRQLQLPILVGASRKSFLGQILGLPAESRLLGSIAAATVAALEGAHILRVHDVKETIQVMRVCDAILRGNV